MPVFSAFTVVRQSSPEAANINHQSLALKPLASNTSPQEPIIAFLRKRLARRGAEFIKLEKFLIASKNSVLGSESSLSTAALAEATLCPQVVTLQTELSAARASLTTACLPADSATLAQNATHYDNQQLESRIPESSATVDDMRLQMQPQSLPSFLRLLSRFVASATYIRVFYVY